MARSRVSPASAVRRGAHRRPILIGLMVTMGLSAMDNTIVATAIPQVVRDLGGFTLFSWVFSSYLLTQTVSIPIYGKLADQWGRKPILLIGTVVFLAGSALCAASWSMVSLICFRGLQGLGAGSIMATVNTLAGDLYELEERGRVQGWLSSVWGISAVFAPTLGGSLAQYASWRWIFLINLPLGAASIALIGRYLHEQVSRSRHRIDVAGALTVLVAAGALVFGLLQGGVAWPWWSRPSVAVFAVAVAATVAAVVAERRAAEPILPPWLWRQRALAGFGLAASRARAAGHRPDDVPAHLRPAGARPERGGRGRGAGHDELRLAAGHLAVRQAVPAARVPRHRADRSRRSAWWRSAGVPVAAGPGAGLAAGRRHLRAGHGPRAAVGLRGGGTRSPRWGGASAAWSPAASCSAGTSARAWARRSSARSSTPPSSRACGRPRRRCRPHLPHSASGVSATIGHTASLGPAVGYLRAAISAATHNVYVGLVIAAVATIAVIAVVIPRHMSTAASLDHAPEQAADQGQLS